MERVHHCLNWCDPGGVRGHYGRTGPRAFDRRLSHFRVGGVGMAKMTPVAAGGDVNSQAGITVRASSGVALVGSAR